MWILERNKTDPDAAQGVSYEKSVLKQQNHYSIDHRMIMQEFKTACVEHFQGLFSSPTYE